MPASFPTSEKSFTTKVDGVDYPQAAHINDLQLEVAALEAEIGASSDTAAAVFARIGNQTEDTAHPSTDYIGTSAGKKIGLQDAFGFCIGASYLGYFSPADSTTYYFGENLVGLTISPSATSALFPITVRRTGTIYAIDLSFTVEGTNGSAETFSAWFRLNDTTDTLISSSCQMDADFETFSNTGLNIAIASGDTFEIKFTTPAFATNPTNTRAFARVWMR